MLLYCEQQFPKVRGYQEIDQVIANIDFEFTVQPENFLQAAQQ